MIAQNEGDVWLITKSNNKNKGFNFESKNYFKLFSWKSLNKECSVTENSPWKAQGESGDK